MRIGLKFREQLNKLPGLVDELESAYRGISGGYGAQHNDDDSHGTITASGSISERGRTTPMGEWIKPPFIASNFTASNAGTWAVTIPSGTGTPPISYTLVGKTMTVNVYATGTLTLPNPTPRLLIAIPSGIVPSNTPSFRGIYYQVPCLYNGTVGILRAEAGQPRLFVETLDQGAATFFAAGSILVSGQISFEIQTS